MPDDDNGKFAERQRSAPASDVLAPLVGADPNKPYVIAQLGQSLDGRIATPTGASRWINGHAALDHLHRLRASVDAVVIGVGTALADDPLLTVRRVAGRQPARVVIDPHGRLHAGARCFAVDGVRCLVVSARATTPHADIETVVVPLQGRFMTPQSIVEALSARGLNKILIEGGATTVSAFVDAGVLDRLHVLVAPIVLGSGTVGLTLAPIAGLDGARRPGVKVHILDDGDVLFDCDMKPQEQR